MRSVEFCYWLQGYFELRETDSILTFDQVDCIREHIKLTEAVEKDNLNDFVMWLKGALDIVSRLESIDNNDITNLIKVELGKCFKHEVDDSYGNNLSKIDKKKLLEKLDEIHPPKKSKTKIDPWRSPIVYRC